MQIFLNEEILDTKLENEKTVAEVYSGVKTWIEKNGKYLVSCKVDGYEKEQNELESISLESVARVDFYVGEGLDVLIGSLIELDNYVNKIGETLFGRDSLTEKESKDLKEGKIWISSVLNAAKSMLRIDFDKIKPHGLDYPISTVIEEILTEKKLDSVKSIENYLEHLRDFKLFVMDLINRITLLNLDTETVKEILSTYGNNMEVLKKEFISVNENFQSGKDLLATELLQHSSGRLHLLISGLISVAGRINDYNVEAIRVEDDSLLSINTLLNDKLSQVAQALEENDIVTVGDILEYELPEILDKFVPFLKLIREKL
jgi:hypothetical protein